MSENQGLLDSGTPPGSSRRWPQGPSPTPDRLAHEDTRQRPRSPGTDRYGTPWDSKTPDSEAFLFDLGSPSPAHSTFGAGESARARLLRDEQSPLTPTSALLGHPYFAHNYRSKMGSFKADTGHRFDEVGGVPNSANSRTEFLLAPSSASASTRTRQRSDWVPASHPWWPDTFEPVHWPPLLFLFGVVVLAYPLLYGAAQIASGKDLFWTRSIVGAVASVLGFVIGLALMEISKRILEASTWATLIHHSIYTGSTGFTLEDLSSKSEYPNYTWLGLCLLIERTVSTTFRRGPRSYDRKPWSLFVIFFILISVTAASITFLLGRLVEITTSNRPQYNTYQEVSVVGDLSDVDMSAAEVQFSATESFVQTWTLSPYGAGGQVPVPVRVKFQGEDVYFSEITTHLLPGGSGLGTFQQDQQDRMTSPSEVPTNPIRDGQPTVGSIVRYMRWGLRIKCTKLLNPSLYIVPKSQANITYAYIPRDIVTSLLSNLHRDDVNFTWDRTFLQGEDTVPEGIDMSTIGLVGVWWNNGVAQSFYSYTIDRGEEGNGWVALDVVMMRLNTTYTPFGAFGVSSDQIGYDAAVCIQAIEPWIVDAYNATTGRASTLKVVGKGGKSSLGLDLGSRQGPVRTDLSLSLNSTGRWHAFAVAHDNSRNQMLKDNGRDFFWVPNPTAISWTDGSGPRNYTSLSAQYLEVGLGKADAAQLLSYLTGSQPVLAYRYTEATVSDAAILTVPTLITLIVILLLGVSAALLVPRLPLGLPRRDFGLFTWLAVFEGDELLNPTLKGGVARNMDLEEMHRKLGPQKVKYEI